MNFENQIFLGGGCHCGNLSLSLSIDANFLNARRCSCDFCSKHGAVWVSDSAGKLAISLGKERLVRRYVFATESAKFLFCNRCGVVCIALTEIESKTLAVVNFNVLDVPDDLAISIADSEFGEESLKERQAQRKRSWIPQVSF